MVAIVNTLAEITLTPIVFDDKSNTVIVLEDIILTPMVFDDKSNEVIVLAFI